MRNLLFASALFAISVSTSQAQVSPFSPSRLQACTYVCDWRNFFTGQHGTCRTNQPLGEYCACAVKASNIVGYTFLWGTVRCRQHRVS